MTSRQLPHSHHEGGFFGSLHRRVGSDSLAVCDAHMRVKVLQVAPEVRHENVCEAGACIGWRRRGRGGDGGEGGEGRRGSEKEAGEEGEYQKGHSAMELNEKL